MPAASLDFHEPPPVIRLENAGTFLPTAILPEPPPLLAGAGFGALVAAFAGADFSWRETFFLPAFVYDFTGFENGVEVELIAQIHEFLAQRRDVNLARDVDDHLYGKHWRAGVSGRVAARVQLGDVDAAGAEETRQVVHDARLVQAHHVDRIRDHILARRTLIGTPQADGDARGHR